MKETAQSRVKSSDTRVAPPIVHQVLRSTGNADYESLYFAKDGVGFTGASKLRENSMVRLRVDTPKGPIEVLGVIVHCATEGSLHRMEAKLFAAEQQTLRTWLGFYSSLV